MGQPNYISAVDIYRGLHNFCYHYQQYPMHSYIQTHQKIVILCSATFAQFWCFPDSNNSCCRT